MKPMLVALGMLVLLNACVIHAGGAPRPHHSRVVVKESTTVIVNDRDYHDHDHKHKHKHRHKNRH